MTVRFQQPEKYGLYFITFTCHNWLSLFELTKSYDVVYNWFHYLTKTGNHVCGYVIMPNHVHVLVAFRNHEQSINTRVGEAKRFTAYELVKRLKQANMQSTLDILQSAVNTTDAIRGKKHQVFEPSFDCKECRSREFIVQKLNYMHNNPCTDKWQLVTDPIDYIHSSAKYYETGLQGMYPVTGYMMLEDFDLSVSL